MKVEIEDGRIRINIHDLLSHLEPEEKRAFVDSLACEDDVIKDVAAQIIDGWTEQCSHGYKHAGDVDPSTPLDKAVRAVALGASEVAAKEVRQLCDTIRRQHAYHDQTEKWANKMYHQMHDAQDSCEPCPAPPRRPSVFDATPDAWVVVKKEPNDV